MMSVGHGKTLRTLGLRWWMVIGKLLTNWFSSFQSALASSNVNTKHTRCG